METKDKIKKLLVKEFCEKFNTDVTQIKEDQDTKNFFKGQLMMKKKGLKSTDMPEIRQAIDELLSE